MLTIRKQILLGVACWVGLVACGSLQAETSARNTFVLKPASIHDYIHANSTETQATTGEDDLLDPAVESVTVTPPSLSLTPIRYTQWGFAKDLLQDQWTIWSSPLDASRKDLKWILPVGLAAGALIPADKRISESIGSSWEGPSLKLSLAGGPASIGTAAGLFGIGHFAKKPYLRETGMLGVRATMDAWLTVKLIKSATNRERPHRDQVDQRGGFWSGGKSFPSGHSAETWALATVIAKRYNHKPWVRFGAYAFAAGISASRVGGQKHFPSDVIIGGLIGHLIGRYVVRSWQKKRRALELRQSLASRAASNP